MKISLFLFRQDWDESHMHSKCSAFLDFEKKRTEINSLTDFTFLNSSRCDETEVIAFAFDVGSNFINCEYFLKDENILVHFYDMKNVCLHVCTSTYLAFAWTRRDRRGRVCALDRRWFHKAAKKKNRLSKLLSNLCMKITKCILW